ncbi:MAG: transglutaminase domain-containing protein [Nanoarchaeota archaeon]|nr:transglutaminase domain-containing protein [Nanoarchaeota archaeon]
MLGRLAASLLITISLVGCSTHSKKIDIVQDCLEQTAKIPHDHRADNYFQTPKQTAKLRKGNCSDKAAYLQYLLKQKGIPSKIDVGILSLSSFNGTYHMWVDCEGEVLDPSKPPKGFRMKMSKATEFFYMSMMNKTYQQQIEELHQRIENGE